VNQKKRITDGQFVEQLLKKGMQARVAKRLKISKSMVSQVASRKKRSKRVEKALLSEARGIERLVRNIRVGKEAA
jgi:predicted transcriptional regulator